MQPVDQSVAKGHDPLASEAAGQTAAFGPDTAQDAPSPGGTVDHLSASPGETADYAPLPPGGTVDHVPAVGAGTIGHVADEKSAKAATTAKRADIPGYELLGVLGRGGMGIVYKARQVKADRVVAVKLMLHADHADRDARDRFDTEAQAVARLQHPNIVQVFEVGEAGGAPFFSLEFVPGGSLSKRIKESMLPPREAAALVGTLGRAMAYAHRAGILHRDLKPDNVLLTMSGEPKIADFGLARKLEADSRVTQAGRLFGTPSYMPPEQTTGDLDAVGPAADVYSLGAVLYELLTGRPPFVGANLWETIEQVRRAEPVAPHVLRPAVPRDLETICLKCLRKDAAARYESADALAEDLQRYLDGVPILARPTGPVERTVRWCRRNPWPTALVATLVVALAASTVAAVHIREQGRISETRLSVYKDSVSTFVNEFPTLGDNVPLAGGLRRDMLELVNRTLVESQGKASVGPANEHGMIALELRKGDLASSRFDYEKADEAYQLARRLAEDALQGNPKERDKAVGNLATILYEQARLALAQRRLSDAAELLERSVALRRQVADAPVSGEILPAQANSDLARVLLRLSEVHRRKGDAALALQAVDEADARVAKASDGTLPPAKATQLDKARADAALERARALVLANKPDEARVHYAQGCDLLRAMIDPANPSPTARLNLAAADDEVGDWLLVHAADPAEALKFYRESQAHYRAVLNLPDVLNLQQSGEAMGYYRLGAAASRSGDPKAALDFFQRCFALRDKRVRDLEEAGDGREKDASRRWEIVYAKIARMLAQARSGRHAEAAVTAGNMLNLAAKVQAEGKELGRVPELCLQAGCGFSICASFLPADSPERAKLLAKSVDALRKARDAGYRNVVFLATDPDLDTVRPTADFQLLFAEYTKPK